MRKLREQRDVVAWWQLRDAGLDADRIGRIVDAGMLRPLPGRVFTTTTDAWSVQRNVGPPCSPEDATPASPAIRSLRWSTLPRSGARENIHIVIPGSAGRPTPGVTIHRTTKLADAERVRCGEYPGTTVSRALIDAASDSDVDTLAAYFDRAVMLGKYDAIGIDRVLKDRRVIPGRATFNRRHPLLDASTGRFLSEFERKVYELIRRSTRIDLPVVNVLAEG